MVPVIIRVLTRSLKDRYRKEQKKTTQKLVDHYLFQNTPINYLHALPVMKSIEIFNASSTEGNLVKNCSRY